MVDTVALSKLEKREMSPTNEAATQWKPSQRLLEVGTEENFFGLPS
jgi:hypothetical protein